MPVACERTGNSLIGPSAYMTDLLTLNDDQQFFIRCVGEPFLQFQQWPIFEHVEAQLDKQGLEARQVLASLPVVGEAGVQHFRYGLVLYPSTIPTADTPILLTVAGLWHLADPSALRICDQFIHVLRYLIERRLTAPSSPFKLNTVQLTDQNIASRFPNMIPGAMGILGQLLPHEAATWHGASDPDTNNQWTIDLHRALLTYRGVNTVVDYINRATEHLTPPEAEPAPAILSPLDLAATLDYFNAVWQLHFDRKKPIIRLFGAERTARLVYDINTAEEFSSQVSCLTDILKNMQVSGDPKAHRTALERIQALLTSKLPEDSETRIEKAVGTLRNVAEVRNAFFQHGGAEYRGVQALTLLGIGFPITDWQSAWATVQRRTIDAFNGLREEIQQFHDTETE